MPKECSLPTDLLSERMVLGSILLNSRFFYETQGSLTIDDFSIESHRTIYKRICELGERGESIDRVTVFTELEKFNEGKLVGGLSYLLDLDEGLPELPSIESYVRSVGEKAMLRRLVFLFQAMRDRALMAEDSAEDIIASAETELAEISRVYFRSRKLLNTRDMIKELGVTELLAGRKPRGVMLPWERLQDALCGLGAGQMVVLMAATSRGKTSLALQIAFAAARQKLTPVIWPLEMNPLALFQRMVTQISGVYAGKSLLSFQELEAQRLALCRLDEQPIYFDPFSRSVSSFVASCRQIRAKSQLGLAVVDYLQLIRGNGKNRAQEVSDNSRALKLAAMDLGVPFVVLSQVDRSSVKGEGKIGLHSAKESGDIENDADVVLWIEGGELSRTDTSSVSLHVGKQREGPAGFSIPMMFNPNSQSFSEIAE